MYNYIITDQNYPVCKARGKKQAIEFVKKRLQWDGIIPSLQKWEKLPNGNIRVRGFEIIKQD